MDFITNNWQFILGCIVAIAVGVILIVLYRKNKINEEYLQTLADYLDSIDDGEGVVPLLAAYAKRAVLAVEQMVKAGVLQKTNDARKEMAMRIVSELATADGIELNEADKSAADYLVESEVYSLKYNG